MNLSKKQLGFALPIAILIVVVLVIAGGVGYYSYTSYKAYQEIKKPEEKAPEEMIKDETADWKIYRSEEYSFEVKYPQNWNITEMEPASDEDFLSKIYMFEAAGLFANEIQIFENKSALDGTSQLRDFIMQWYGLNVWPTQFPLSESKIKEFKINNQPAIQIDYIEKGEDPAADVPAILLFSLTKQYFYRLGCMGKCVSKGNNCQNNCYQILSTFKFIDGIYVGQKPKQTEVASITLISPNGGETWKIGSTHTIKWTSQNIPPTDKISIHIRRVPPSPLPEIGQEFDPVIFIELENTGSVDWTISRATTISMYPAGSYIIEVNSYPSIPITTKSVSDESDNYFSITEPEKAMGYIKAVYDKGGKEYLDIDYVQWLTGDEAIKAMREDGKCPPDIYPDPTYCIPNGFYIRNLNPKIRTFEISKDVEIFMTQNYGCYGEYKQVELLPGSTHFKIDYRIFKSFWEGNPACPSYLKELPYNIGIEDNRIIEIREQFLP